jgi:hypothetical protein
LQLVRKNRGPDNLDQIEFRDKKERTLKKNSEIEFNEGLKEL